MSQCAKARWRVVRRAEEHHAGGVIGVEGPAVAKQSETLAGHHIMKRSVYLGLLGAVWTLLAGVGVAEEPKGGDSGPEAGKAPFAAEADGSFLLHSRRAKVTGKALRFEPKPEKNTLGYWTQVDDWASWSFAVVKPGVYEVEVLQGCGKGSGGAEVEVVVAGQPLRFTVEDTGHFQNFRRRTIGTVSLEKAGVVTLEVRPKTKPGVAVMDLREIVVRPKP